MFPTIIELKYQFIMINNFILHKNTYNTTRIITHFEIILSIFLIIVLRCLLSTRMMRQGTYIHDGTQTNRCYIPKPIHIKFMTHTSNFNLYT